MDEIIDWNKFKSKAKGWNLERAKQGYIDLCELLNKNNHTLLSEYVGATTKVLIDFKCGHKPHEITPNKYKTGRKCPKCVGKGGQAEIDFINMLDDNGHTLLSEYVNETTKVMIDYNCGHKPHEITPNSYKNGSRCPKCAGTCPEQAKIDFINMLDDNGHTLLSEYIDSTTKVLIDFNCGHEAHMTKPVNYKSGRRCPECGGIRSAQTKSAQSKEEFIKLVNDNGHKLLSEYINAKNKVLIDFNCGHKPHEIQPDSYKIGQRCPKCSGKCKEQAKEELIKLVKENGHKLLSEYKNSDTKVLIDFNCGHKPHEVYPNNYKKGHGCPYCINKGEGELHQLLIDMFKEVETQKTYNDLKDKDYLRYDFYLPEYNLLIELDGEHHREKVIYKNKNITELEKYLADIEANERLQNTQYKDKLKDNYAKDNNIPLLRIEYSKGITELDKWKKLIEDTIKEINFR